jgi:beta-mannosidase
MLEGDVHDWHVWHGLPVRETDEVDLLKLWTSGPEPEDVSFIHYAEDMGRFISEFGMHASPVYETLRRCMPSDQLYHHSPAMDHHNKDNPKNKGDNLMLTVTGLPEDLEQYIDFSMIAQAEGLKSGSSIFAAGNHTARERCFGSSTIAGRC